MDVTERKGNNRELVIYIYTRRNIYFYICIVITSVMLNVGITPLSCLSPMLGLKRVFIIVVTLSYAEYRYHTFIFFSYLLCLV